MSDIAKIGGVEGEKKGEKVKGKRWQEPFLDPIVWMHGTAAWMASVPSVLKAVTRIVEA